MPRLGCWNIHASLLPRWRGPRLFSGRLWRAIQKPASPSCKWRRGWIQVPCFSLTRRQLPPMIQRKPACAACRFGSAGHYRAMAGADEQTPVPQPDEGFAMPIKLTRPRRALTGRGRRMRLAAIFAACHHFQALGLRSTARALKCLAQHRLRQTARRVRL